jgi:hypothetical protein
LALIIIIDQAIYDHNSAHMTVWNIYQYKLKSL